MRNYTLLWIICILLISASPLIGGSWQWATSFGGQGMESAWDMDVNTFSGDIYVCGDFTDSLVVDGSVYPASGESDSYIIKYNSLGMFQWIWTCGSSEQDVCLSIATDAAGNCCFSGFYSGTLVIGNNQYQSNGGWEGYLGKLSADGELLWFRSFGGPLTDLGYGISVDQEGNCYVTGWFGGTIDFGNNISITSFGGSDIFLLKTDPNGNPLWARHAGTAGVEYGYKVDVSSNGYAYVTGHASPGSDFDGVVTDASGMFVAKYDPMGNIEWVLPSYNTGAINIGISWVDLVSHDGVVIGRVTGTGIIGDTVINSVNESDDIYVAKFSSDGSWTEVQHYGGPGSDKGRAVDNRNPLTMLFSFEQQIDIGNHTLNSNGLSDVVIYNSIYPPVSFGGENVDIGNSVKRLPLDRFVVTGWFSGVVRFGNHVINSGSNTNQDGFVALYDALASNVDDPNATVHKPLLCYPNPSSQSITIESKGLDKVKVYNIRGQLIRELVPNRSVDGINSFYWDGRDASSVNCSPGVYLVKAGLKSAKVILLDK